MAQNAKTSKNENTVWSPMVKTVAIVCAIILAAAILLAAVAKAGFFEKQKVAMKVGDTKISAHELNYSYYAALNSFYSQYYSYISNSIDFSSSLKDQKCTFDTSISWYDYFLRSARADCEETYLLYNQAIAENFEMTQESKDSLEKTISDLKDAAKENGTSLNKYLASAYGRGMTESLYREYLEHRLLAADFYQAYQDALNYTDEQVEAKYTEDKNKYDKADYYSYTVTVAADTSDTTENADETSEEQPAEEPADTRTAAQIAEEIKEQSTSLEAFLDAIKAREGEESFNAENYLRSQQTYTEDNEVSAWVFSADRAEGDVGLVEDDGGSVTVVWFLGRSRAEYKLASMRHILLKVEDLKDDDGNTKTDEDGKTLTNDEEQKEKAEALLKTWTENGGTEDAFVALVADNTDDTASASTGGLYEDFDQDYMVTDITDWIWAEGRAEGDCEIVKSTYGYHLVYFVGYGETKWKSTVVADMKAADYDAYKEGLKTTYPVENFDDALKYVGY